MEKMRNLRIGAIQFARVRSKEENISRAVKLIRECAKKGCDFVCLPEKWSLGNKPIDKEAELDQTITLENLKEAARENKIYIVGGAILESEGQNYFVSSYIFDPEGKIVGKQRKIHLYEREKNIFSPGNQLNIFETEFGKIGVLICFDLIFPELPRFLALKGIEILFCPVAIVAKGISNWHIYLRARALENRVPVVGVNLVDFINDIEIPGRSLIVGFKRGPPTPVLIQTWEGVSNEESIIIADLDLEFAKQIRSIRLGERQRLDEKILRGLIETTY